MAPVIIILYIKRTHTHKETLAKSIEKSYERWFWVKWTVDETLNGL